jgi:hypothetical protein
VAFRQRDPRNQPCSAEFAVFEQKTDQPSELLGVLWGGIELVLELNKSASILELSASSRSISLSSCYGFAGLRLHPLLVRDLPLLVFFPQLLVFSLELLHSILVLALDPLELDLSQLVIDNGSPVQHRQTAPEPRQGGVVLRFAD